ncbi:heterokaryon incompatibility protein-domain-containing protein [Achaetomium macrosporum]|uniref:Heterokaryon incompatibility protein-domain-containing protein n=1 Tax=Achaetomium macrosporum TaxID=79813 RepID=A0AAN7C1I9_9PEZI|nr:heterokaryon incompatibility protein-domain-containing protein [Achaetomium macrosporum]
MIEKYLHKITERREKIVVKPLEPSPLNGRKATPTLLRFSEYPGRTGGGIKSVFSQREIQFDLDKWASLVPEGAHSCHDCRRLLIDGTELEASIEHESCLLALSDIEAASSRCTVFRWLREFVGYSGPPFVVAEERVFVLSLAHLKPPSRDILGIGFASDDGNRFSHEQRGYLGVFVREGDPEAEFISSRPLNCDVASKQNFRASRKWLKKCHRNHAACRGSQRGRMPTRLLKITRGRIKLIETDRGPAEKYAALSYCWGGDQACKLTMANRASRLRDSISAKDLPRTIADAVVVTENLKLRYLWVDSLCIVQDDVEDQKREIPAMSEIFETAYVTISAASARTSCDGFLHQRKPEIAVIPYFLPTAELGALSVYREMDAAEEPIHSRAWTLQEHVHACRILEYGSQQLRRVCRGAPLNADLRGLRELAPPTTLDPTEIGKSDMWAIWQQKDKIRTHRWRPLVKNYTQRHLTKPSDRPLGIYSIALEYSRQLGSRYKAGLWEKFLKQDLLWQRDASDPRQARRLDHRRYPSWSWLSVDSAVIIWQVCPMNREDETLEIRDCYVNERLWYDDELPSPPTTPLPPTLPGNLLAVRGHVRKALWTARGVLVASHGYAVAQVVADVPGEEGDGEVLCLEVVKDVAGLVLTPCQDGAREGFRRIGLWTVGIQDLVSPQGIAWLKSGGREFLSLL